MFLLVRTISRIIYMFETVINTDEANKQGEAQMDKYIKEAIGEYNFLEDRFKEYTITKISNVYVLSRDEEIKKLIEEINLKLDLLIDICKRDYTTGYKDLSKMLNENLEET